MSNQIYIELDAGLDIMGDGHGLLSSRVALIEKAGYMKGTDGLYRHPDGRKLVYLNDESSRGSLPHQSSDFGQYPSISMLIMMKRQVEAGLAYAVDSNHNYKIWRWLDGRKVKLAHGDELVAEEFKEFEREYGDAKTRALKSELCAFMKSLPSHVVIVHEGIQSAVAVHAGIRDDMIGKNTSAVYDFCRFGSTAGFDDVGKPIRLDWTSDHENGMLIVWGHVPHPEPVLVHNTINIDQGGFCGHYLTMLRYPEMEIIQEKVPQCFVSPEDNPILKAMEH